MLGQNALGYGHIIRERYRWILNHADGVPVLLEDFVDFFPTGAIHEATVDENYCLYSRIRFAVHFISFLCFVICFANRESVMSPNETEISDGRVSWQTQL
jgi:hypothetical protein